MGRISKALKKLQTKCTEHGATPKGKSTADVLECIAEHYETGGYSLPAATAETLGGVKVGYGLTADENGVLSVAAEEKAVEDYVTQFSKGIIELSCNYADANEHYTAIYSAIVEKLALLTGAKKLAFAKAMTILTNKGIRLDTWQNNSEPVYKFIAPPGTEVVISNFVTAVYNAISSATDADADYIADVCKYYIFANYELSEVGDDNDILENLSTMLADVAAETTEAKKQALATIAGSYFFNASRQPELESDGVLSTLYGDIKSDITAATDDKAVRLAELGKTTIEAVASQPEAAETLIAHYEAMKGNI